MNTDARDPLLAEALRAARASTVGLRRTRYDDWLEALADALAAALAREQTLRDALARIADGTIPGEPLTGILPAVIHGKPTTLRYMRRAPNAPRHVRDYARAALDAVPETGA